MATDGGTVSLLLTFSLIALVICVCVAPSRVIQLQQCSEEGCLSGAVDCCGGARKGHDV